MSESENTMSLTGRGFRTALEASVVCEAIEKSSLDPVSKNAVDKIIDVLTVGGLVEVVDLLNKVKELFADNSENYDIVVNVVISVQQQINF